MKTLKTESQIEMLKEIADHHDLQATMADAMDAEVFATSITYHEGIAKAARALAALIRGSMAPDGEVVARRE